MSLPMPANDTCDIYRSGNSPPSAPDVASVKCFLMPLGQSTLTTSSYTHVLYVDAAVDVRDNFISSSFSPGGSADNVYIPSQSGTKFAVVLVRRYGKGTPSDHKRVLLLRQAPTWPTNDV
jgi:hypothetical protein